MLMGVPRERYRNLQRYEHNYFTGWVVSLTRRGERYTRYFPDKKDSQAALRRALAWRDALIRKLPPPVKVRMHWPYNKTGVIGVSLLEDRTRGGTLVKRFVATWVDEHGHDRKRSFSVPKYGHAKARAMAVAARHQGVAEMMARRPKGPLPPLPPTRRRPSRRS
jgi:hypothetical protein